jgi:glycine/D-amino acid oxidase-like deaminating enzyme
MSDVKLNRDFEERPYWHATMPKLPDRSGRRLPDTADVVVIGGGYTGIAAARKLALQGARPVVLEAETLGFGGASRNGGLVLPGYKWGYTALKRRYGPELGRTLYTETLDAVAFLGGLIRDQGIDAEYRETGAFDVAWAPVHADEFAQAASDLAEVGVSARVVPKAEMRTEIGSDAFHGGLLIEAGGVLHPGKWFAGLVGLAERAGVELHEGVRARRPRRQADGRFVVETNRGAILARDVLVATNGYTDAAAPAARRRLVAIGSYIIATEPLPEDLVRELSPNMRAYADTRNFLNYWHISADRRMIFGGRVSFIPTTIRRTARLLHRRLLEVHPQLADYRVEYAWGGKVALAMDRMPHVVRQGGVAFCGGYAGHGVVLSTWLGTRTAEWMGGGAPPTVARLRFPLIPAPYEGRAWFMPLLGEAFRAQDRLDARKSPKESPAE